MAVSWVGGATLQSSGGTSVNITAPAGVDDDDLILVGVVAESTLNTPSGWTKVAEATAFSPDGSFFRYHAVFSKNTVTSADASATFNFSHNDVALIAATLGVFRGHDGIAATDTVSNSSVNVWTVTPAPLTAAGAGAMLVCFGAAWFHEDPLTPNVPTSFTRFSGAGLSNYAVAGAYREVAAGQSNSGAFDFWPTATTNGDTPQIVLGVDNGLAAITLRLEAAAAATPEGYSSAATMLGAPAARTVGYREGVAAADSPLGAVLAAVLHDFTGAIAGRSISYVMDLTTPGGDVRVPIRSWQATLQTDRQTYVQCVVPACLPYVDDLNAATAFAIRRRALLASGEAFEYTMAEAPISYLQFAQGTANYSASINGYADAFAAVDDPPAAYDRVLTGQRTIFSGAGGYRVRCAIDWLLRPGHRAFIDDSTSFVVAYVSYFVQGSDEYMDVGQRVSE